MITVLMAMEMALWTMMGGREAIRLVKGVGKVQPRRDEKRYKTTILEQKIHKMGWRGTPKDSYGNASGLDDRPVSYGLSIGVGSGIGAYGRWPSIRWSSALVKRILLLPCHLQDHRKASPCTQLPSPTSRTRNTKSLLHTPTTAISHPTHGL